jgi:precorrin-3B C17-methyltransferase
VLRHRDPDTPCGWVRNVGREGQESRILTLAQLQEEQLDMFTTVFIGSSQTRMLHGRLVTPRGYLQR